MKNPIPKPEEKLDVSIQPTVPMPGPVKPVVEDEAGGEGKAMTMWAAVCLIVQAIAQNVRDADIIRDLTTHDLRVHHSHIR